MTYNIDYAKMDIILDSLKEKYNVYGPVKTRSKGIVYGKVKSASDIVYDEKTTSSPKEVIYPVVQKLLYFTADECVETKLDDDKGILLFARPCDINGLERLDLIFNENGNAPDFYYARLREKLKVVMIECRESFENCFCCSMATNKTDNYSMAVKFDENGLLASVKDDELRPYFKGKEAADYTPSFVEENQIKVEVPKNITEDMLEDIYALDLWKEYNENCMSCGRCNARCISCSCFDTIDITYNETSKDGERRRVWSSCMLEDFSTMAGGHGVRSSAGDRMRFKTMHKIYDFDKRFGKGNMCVGCGRCSDSCSKDISFSDTINKLSLALNKQEGAFK